MHAGLTEGSELDFIYWPKANPTDSLTADSEDVCYLDEFRINVQTITETIYLDAFFTDFDTVVCSFSLSLESFPMLLPSSVYHRQIKPRDPPSRTCAPHWPTAS